jgi:glucosamine 6-phosphate synthetase-like amidotransferase/phosphosugar isomerase protein
MCGITGCIVNNNPSFATEVYFKLLKASDIRGQDGTGLTLLRNKKFYTYKWPIRARDISFDLALEKGDKIIGQNRYAIFGLDFSNNQPITFDNLSLVHNGVLYNYEKQKKLFEEKYNIYQDTQVDTELIVRLLHLFLSQKIKQKDAIKDVLSVIDGEAACICLDCSNSSLYAFMKNKILYRGEDEYGNVYFFSTLYIKNKVSEISKNIIEFKDCEVFVWNN